MWSGVALFEGPFVSKTVIWLAFEKSELEPAKVVVVALLSTSSEPCALGRLFAAIVPAPGEDQSMCSAATKFSNES